MSETTTDRLTMDDLCDLLGIDPDDCDEDGIAALIDRGLIAAELTLHLCDGPSSETRGYSDDDDPEAIAAEWVRGGDWGDDGASIDVSWWITDAAHRETNRGRLTVDVEPDHAAMIRAAMGDAESCGDDPDDHEWTSQGEGGCDENPGVWSTGGTSMKFTSHCRRCGLHRTEETTGSQRNPGEHDTTEYRLLDDDEIEAHRRAGSMDEQADAD